MNLKADEIIAWGPQLAKVRWEAIEAYPKRGQLILVSAMSPAPAGEGKTTVAIGLLDALRQRGHSATAALRQPSLGPVFGSKGGATGGGRAQLVPADSINLHCTGDFHAITSAHNLLSAVIDNHLHRGHPKLDGRRILWPRVMDMNDRALRHCLVGLGGPLHGQPREERFEITAASEIMAILALSQDWQDLRRRLGNILVCPGVRAEDLGAAGAMAALLRDAMLPNLVHTLEGNPVLLHCGPFANIAHGTSSLVATRLALSRADYVLQEAGFGADLGGEKFLNIFARELGQAPSLAVVVVTLQGLKYHGASLEEGLLNPLDQLRRLQRLGVPVVAALNPRNGDSPEELGWVRRQLGLHGYEAFLADVYARGGEGALELADYLAQPRPNARLQHPYEPGQPAAEKIAAVACQVYGAEGVDYSAEASAQMAGLPEQPAYICVAKTQYSISDDPSRRGLPGPFRLQVRSLKYASGAGLLVPICGDIQTMPGLSSQANYQHIQLLADGSIEGVH
ncbi:formate--tetrahydrofolate ligase [bacterium]|nr:formate--tetrahydrofolate ligase [bacterium]